MSDDTTPVLIGAGQLLNRIASLDETVEPVDMMIEASRRAAADTGVPDILRHAQSVRVIRGIWPYENPAAYVATRVGAPDAQTVGTVYGGNYVQSVVNHTARSILNGELDLALVIGKSSASARKAGVDIPMRETPGHYDALFGHGQQPEHHAHEVAMGIRQAIQIYPMYENAIRHARGETLDEHMTRVSQLWSRFNDVAQGNPNAWVQQNLTAEQIRTASPSNRQISFPYTKFMNANMSVDMSAALILCSVSRARALGVSDDRWIYPIAGVEGKDHFSASVRDNFYTSPAIRIIGHRLADQAATALSDIEFVDLYSCFPSAVQVAARELGLSEARALTVTGGLTFGGGPLNNYVMHAIARMVELLREHRGQRGLITANGGNLYKHAHCIYAAERPESRFQLVDVQADIDALPARETVAGYGGDVTIESYTVMFGPDGPDVAHVACLTPGGARTWSNTRDPGLMAAMTTEEFCGRSATVDRAGELLRVA